MVTNVRTSMRKVELVSIVVVCRSYVIPARGLQLLAKYPDKQGDWASWGVREVCYVAAGLQCHSNMLAPCPSTQPYRGMTRATNNEPAAELQAQHKTDTALAIAPDPQDVCDVFLSHAGEQKKAFADCLYQLLVRAGGRGKQQGQSINVFMDQHSLQLGDQPWAVMEEKARTCRIGGAHEHACLLPLGTVHTINRSKGPCAHNDWVCRVSRMHCLADCFA
jgi:hypothetical protein